MKRFLALILCTVCLCSTAVFAAASTGTAKINGKNAPTVTVGMGSSVSVDVGFAEGCVNKDAKTADMVSAAAAKGNLIAAVNGGFFNAYYDKNGVDGYGKVARCQVNVVKDGRAVNGCGLDERAVYLGFTSDGKALIDELVITQYITFGDSKWSSWGVNSWFEYSNAMMLFTPEAGYDLPLPSGAKASKIVNGVVTDVMSSGTMVCAPNTYYFVCGADLVDRLPAVGTAVSFRLEFSNAAWNKVTTAVSCGPWLLHNGQDVLAENSKYSYFEANKVGSDVKAARTFAAVLGNGDLMLGTCSSASPRQVMEYLQSLGATDAMLLDGGASSMLYANGKTITSAGRKLNNILYFYDSSAAAPAAPATPPAPAAKPTVVLSPQKLAVNGESKATEIYNIDNTNYFKLRDLAALLNGTSAQFNVDFNSATNTIVVRTKTPYTTANGYELQTGVDNSASAVVSAQSLEIDGKKVDLTAYNIGGTNFFGLRALEPYIGYTVGWDAAANTATITSK